MILRQERPRALSLMVLIAAELITVPRLAWVASASAEESVQGLYEAEGKRDPFMPLVRDGRIIAPPVASGADGKPSAALPVLHGILWDAGGHSIALLDAFELQMGDTVRGYKVLEIGQNSVTLERDGKAVTVHLQTEGQGSPGNAGQTQGGGGRP